MIAIIGSKDGKSYKAELSEELVGKRVGEVINGSLLGMEGYELVITGGSDNQGFPMKKSVEGQKRVKSMISGRPGFRPERKGERKRKNIRGRIVSEEIAQVNMKVVKEGSKKISDIFRQEPKEQETKE
jgi:small subunit ribosomal protein S6e